MTPIAEQNHQRALTLFRLRTILQKRVRNDLARIAKLEEQIAKLDAVFARRESIGTEIDTPPNRPQITVSPKP